MPISLAAALLLLQAPLTPSSAGGPHRLLRIDAAQLSARPRLLSALGFDHIARDASSGALEVAASPEQYDALLAEGLTVTVVVPDLESFYTSRLTPGPEGAPEFGAWLTPPFASGAMGGYYTYAQVTSVLDQLHAAYPTLTTAKVAIGTSIEGRSMWMIKISDHPDVDENEPEVRIDALHHAREPEGMQASLWFVLSLLENYTTDPLAKYLVDHRELYFVPVVNPDGYVYNQTTNPGGGGMWRKNRRNNGGGVFGVDLNRNYSDHWGWDNTGSSPTPSSDTYRGPSPASEPEVQAMQNFIASRQFGTALSIHTYSNLWLYPYGYAALYPANNAQYVEVSALATELNQYEVGPPPFVLYTANGGTFDFEHNAHDVMSWSPELGSSSDGFWPPTGRIIPLAQENLLALQRTTLAAGAWVRQAALDFVEVGDGDGFFEAGESVDFTVTARNSGRRSTATNVVLTLGTASPHATFVNSAHDFGAIASFAQAASPTMRLALGANAPGGATIDVDVALEFEGFVQQQTVSLRIGEPVTYLYDDAELDWGWTVTLPGDTASSGRWTRGVPIGTSSSGSPANPSVDFTPAPGTQCFMTGNGGGSAGTDDVDNGFTTLLSPVFDLSNCGPARLSYARWFADLTVADDVFAVSISNDAGNSWTTLETLLGNWNTWQRSTFDVADFLPQTSLMRLRFVATDAPNNSIVEAAIDDLRVEIFDSAPRLNVYGRRTAGSNVLVHLTGPAGASFALRATINDPNASTPPSGASRVRTLATGVIPASRVATVVTSLPSGAAWIGQTLHFRGVVASGALKQLSNWASVVVQ